MYRRPSPLLLTLLAIAAALAPAVAAAQAQSEPQRSRHARAIGDAMPGPLASPGDAQRGRALAADRDGGACVLCHVIPGAPSRFMGNLGPALAGVGSRYSAGELRLRVVDSTRVRPDAAMPAYYRIEDLHDVAVPYRGRTLLTAQQVEDVVAYLQTLK